MNSIPAFVQMMVWQQAIILTNVYWRIYAPLGLNELTMLPARYMHSRKGNTYCDLF